MTAQERAGQAVMAADQLFPRGGDGRRFASAGLGRVAGADPAHFEAFYAGRQ